MFLYQQLLFSESAISITTILEKEIIPDRHIVNRLMLNLAAKTLENKEIQKLLSDAKEYFDVVIVEWMFSDVFAR